MKKFIYIICVALLAASCTDMLDESLRGRGAIKTQVSEFPEGARLTLGFNVPMPVPTKAMTETPSIRTIHVFVFSSSDVSSNGALLEVQKAELGGLVDKNAIMDYTQTYGENGNNGHISNFDANTVLARWSVDLMMGRGTRRLHFVANLPEDYQIPEVGTAEFSVLRSITTTGGEVAYWQMVEVENGILAYTYDGTENYQYVNSNGVLTSNAVSNVPGYVAGSYSSAEGGSYQYKRANASGEMTTYDVGKGDYITTEGLKVLDGGGYYASLDLSQSVNLIPLIRNFARIKVKTRSSSNFRIKKAILINTPESAFVAPFDDASNQFVAAYRNAGTTKPEHTTILATGYPATIPGNSIVDGQPDEEAAIPALHNSDNTVDSLYLYMYERGIPSRKATAMLVYGTLTGYGDRWLKIEISDTNGSFFPIYRDFTYDVEIKSITGTEGYEEMSDAFDNPAIGDISNSPETATLTRIDDGNGLTLWVEYIDYTSTSTTGGNVRLLYKFYKGNNNYTEDNVTLRIDPVTGRTPAISSTSTTLTGTAYSGTADTPDGQGGWFVVQVPLAGMDQDGITKVSTLHVEGKLDAKTMFRDVSYSVLPKQDLTLSATPLASENAGETTTLSVTLPPYLGYSVFPLALMIEAEANNLNPGDSENLSVESGPSLFSTGKNSFYFLKTISYSEYQTSQTYTVDFKTTVNGEETALGTNATTIAVKDKNGYFNTGTCGVTVPPYFNFSNNGVTTVNATVTEATFDIQTNMTGNWTLTPGSGVTITNVVTKAGEYIGSGSATVTVTFPANNSDTDDKTYTVTASMNGIDDQIFTIYQSKRQLKTATGTAEFSSSDFAAGNNISSTKDNIKVSFSRISSIDARNNRIVLDKSGTYTVSFTPDATSTVMNLTISSITITFRNNNYNPSSITGLTYSQGTTATYSGSTTEGISATLTTRTARNEQATHITSIVVEYSYQYYE